MTETLTETFCERCGTRYEFSAPTRLNPLRKTRGLIGGLKNYLTSQDALGDALDDAMRTEEGALATAQLEAFHEAFNFCIDCRQYTCVSCWNDDAGRCRTCVPVPGTDDLAERLAASTAAVAVAEPVAGIAEADMSEEDVRRHLGPDAWPTSDLPEEAIAANGHVPDDHWAATPGAWANAPAAPTYEPEEPVATVGGFVGADGFVYETKEQADQVAANMLAAALAAQEAARAAAELEAAQAAEAAAAEAAGGRGDEALVAKAAPTEPETPWVAAELDEAPATGETPAEPVQAVEPQSQPELSRWPPRPRPSRRGCASWPGTRMPPSSWSRNQSSPRLSPSPLPPRRPRSARRPPSGRSRRPPPKRTPEPIVAEVEAEPIAAAAEVEPEPAAPTPIAPRIAPIRETILHFPRGPPSPRPASPPRPRTTHPRSPRAAPSSTRSA